MHFNKEFFSKDLDYLTMHSKAAKVYLMPQCNLQAKTYRINMPHASLQEALGAMYLAVPSAVLEWVLQLGTLLPHLH
jgi:hypothetical protein